MTFWGGSSRNGGIPEGEGNCLYRGRVMHRRIAPFKHHFVYRVFSLFVDIDTLPGLDRRLRLFSHNRWNLFSLRDKDHGAKDGTALRAWIEDQLGQAKIDISGGRVKLLCFPRILGFVFNPLSVWFCYRRDGSLAAVLYEVRNTFGDWHGYLFPVPYGQQPGKPLLQSCSKEFHVSPFIDVTGGYRFRVLDPDGRLSLVIRHVNDQGEPFVAVHKAERHDLTDRQLIGAFFAYPLMTVKVMTAIHWEALKLWRKGARFYKRPEPPEKEVSIEPLHLDEAAE